MKVEHIGIAVKDLEASAKLFDALLGKGGYKEEYVESEKVTTLFYEAGQPKIELLASEDEESAISKFIEKKGEGIHHIAFAVEDIEAAMKRLEGEGFRLINDQPKRGADNKLICFLHPKTTNGVLIELCQDISQEK